MQQRKIGFWMVGRPGSAQTHDEALTIVADDPWPYHYSPACTALSWMAMMEWCKTVDCMADSTTFRFLSAQVGQQFYERWAGADEVTADTYTRMQAEGF